MVIKHLIFEFKDQEFKKILKMGIYNQLNKDGMLTDMQLDLLKDENNQRFTCI